MKRTKTLILTLIVIALLWPVTAYAKEPWDDKVVFGGTFTLKRGETLDGSLVIFGGAVTLEPDSTTNGDVVLIGGTVEIAGQVNGNLIGIGGAVRLDEQAVVNGDIVTIGATLHRQDGARVTGQVTNGVDIPFTLDVPKDVQVNSGHVPGITVKTNPILDMMWFFFRIFMYAALAVLLVMFFAAQTERITKAAVTQPLITGGAGLLTVVLAPLALIAITITIILIPVTFVAVLLLVAAWLMGWVALGLEVGRRIAGVLDQEWAPAVSAGIGTFILLFVLGGFSELIPCIGWLPKTLVGIWGLGAVLMTRFGTQDFTTFDTNTPVDAPAVVDISAPEAIVDAGERERASSLEFEADMLPEDGLSPENGPVESDE